MPDRIRIASSAREELIDITDEVQGVVAAAGIHTGVLHLWSLHTTCALTVNEGFDPDVASDAVAFMRRLVPRDAGFRHAEGNSDAHLKVAFFGPGLTLLVEEGRPLLGRWQRVFLCEWDGPRRRDIAWRLTPS
ncbi:MAG TPA: secondary thiamine-phosphate synthase enzyme YjbQ [Longimicrobiales bacterium]|nr:secondary thiamine-phosphate synthase enzyme YjbQ [Longimicrobiales bacterium]